jgi:hypothetical protein
MEVEDEIELTDITEIFIQDFYKGMNELKYNKFIIVLIHNSNKVQTCVSLVDDLVFLVVNEITHFGLSRDN